MPRRLDLSSAWAKLDRAKEHIDRLRREIAEAGLPDPGIISVRREYDAQDRAVIFRLDRMVEIRDNWPLLVGDAVHDMRCALDHLMWQLAILYLGRQPTEAEARQIQFPEVKKRSALAGNRFLKFVRNTDIDRLKRFQPYYRRHRLKKGQRHPLPALIRLSNIDKHRRLHLLATVLLDTFLRNTGWRDCVPELRLLPNGVRASIIFNQPKRPVRPDHEILRVFVRPTGPNPDVNFELQPRGAIVTDRIGEIVSWLNSMGEYVAAVLTAFQPRR